MAPSVHCVFIFLALRSLDCLVQSSFTDSYTLLLIVTATGRRGNLIKLFSVRSFPPPLFYNPTTHPSELGWPWWHGEGSGHSQGVKALSVSQPEKFFWMWGEKRAFWLRSNQFLGPCSGTINGSSSKYPLLKSPAAPLPPLPPPLPLLSHVLFHISSRGASFPASSLLQIISCSSLWTRKIWLPTLHESLHQIFHAVCFSISP